MSDATKPDFVETRIVEWESGFAGRHKMVVRREEHWEQPNLALTFDGETGKLIKVELLK